ncbi:ABC transporter permease [Pseudorhodobacter sp. W20_MBD10_FR17]|uniref:ABC transporter permease n=1 Tax=Pseudorhodobacter sp. W20_MBD10_FR17 TaxID=3240266 RepID=UPI003F9B8A34
MLAKLVFKRLLAGIATLFLVSILVFFASSILPGDVAEAVLGQSATPETVAALREKLGLTRPLWEQYSVWLGGFLTGDLGYSLASGAAVSQLILDRMSNTLILAGLTSVIAVPVSIILGLVAATFPGSLGDRLVSVGSLVLVSIPEYLTATILVMVFAIGLKWFPAISYSTEFTSFGQMMSVLALPILALSASITAQMSRMTRATVLNLLVSPYVEMALLKGVSRWSIIFRHVVPNAIGPIANVIALNLAYLLSGVVIVETIFAYPGLAKLLVDAVSSRDFPVVQSCVLLFCAGYVVLMLIADVLAILANPRLRRNNH